MAEPARRCMVTGGRGFAPRKLVEMLIRYEIFSVRIAELRPLIKLEPHEENGLLFEALKSGRAQLGYQIEKVQESNFDFSENMSRKVAVAVVSSWKCTVSSLKALSRGNDRNLYLYFKVVFSLFFLGFLGTASVHSLFVVALPISFSAFYMYEKNEEEIDALVAKIQSFGCKLKAAISKKLAKPKKG